VERRLARANMVWKRSEGRVYLLARGSIYVLNSRAAKLWDMLHGKTKEELYVEMEKSFKDEELERAKELLEQWLKLGFVEEVPWMSY